MKNSLFIALKLTLICFVAVVLLSIINIFTAPQIAKNEIMKEKKTINTFFPGGTISDKKFFPEVGESADFYYYRITDTTGKLSGYCASTVGKGYGGKMKLLVAFGPQLKILDVKLMKNDETPGIGKNAEDAAYMDKFINTNTPDNPFPTSKKDLEQKDADAVTGATITFNGIVGAVSTVIGYIEKATEKE